MKTLEVKVYVNNETFYGKIEDLSSENEQAINKVFKTHADGELENFQLCCLDGFNLILNKDNLSRAIITYRITEDTK